MKMPITLSIAGSDPSAGAGIQQDLKVFTRFGCYGTTVATAITSQNTMGVQDVFALPPQVVKSQLESLFADLDISAVKIGQIPNPEVARVVIDQLSQHDLPIVLDPVMISTSGRRLMEEDCIELLQAELFPRCALVTPNLPETEHLVGRRLEDSDAIYDAGYQLVEEYHCNFLIKGGHLDGDQSVDTLFTTNEESFEYFIPRIKTRNLHGTGCALSSAVASHLALGESLPDAVYGAVQFVHEAIASAVDFQIGHGNGPINVMEA